MNQKAKLIVAVVLGCALILASTTCAGCVTPTTNSDSKTLEIFDNISTTVQEGDQVGVYFSMNIGTKQTFVYAPVDSSFIRPVRVTADSNSAIEDNDYNSITVKTGTTSFPYGIYSVERNAIAKALVGKNYGDTITVSSNMLALCKLTAADLAAGGYDITELKKGDTINMTFAYTDLQGKTAGYLRIGVITAIADDLSDITANFGSDTIDVLIVGPYAT